MIAAAGGSSNTISVLIKLMADPANAKVAGAVNKQLEDLEKRKTDTVRKGANDRGGIVEREHREAVRRGNQGLRETERQLKERDGFEARSLQFQRHELERHEKAKQNAVKQSIKADEQYRQSVRVSTSTAVEGSKQALQGFTSLARGVVLLSAANEETAEKMAQTILKFEAGAQTIKGIVDVVQGGVKVWKAYTTAVQAAAAAEAAASAARGVTGAVGAGASGAGAAGLAGAGAAGIGAAAAVPIAITAAAVSVVAATAMITNAGGSRDKASEAIRKTGMAEPEGWMSAALSKMTIGSAIPGFGIDVTGGLGGMREQAFEAQARTRRMTPGSNTKAEQEARFADEIRLRGDLRNKLFENRMRGAGAAARGSLTGGAADLADIQAQRGVADMALKERQAREAMMMQKGGRLNEAGIRRNITEGDRSQAATDTTTALEKAISLREQERSIVEQIRSTRLSALDQELSKLNQAKQTQESILKTMQQGLQSATERFATSDPGEQRRILEAAEAKKAGKQITPHQLQALRGSGFFEGDKQLDAEAERIARAAGGGALIDEKRQAITAQQKIIAEITGKIEATNNVKIEFTRDNDQQLAAIAAQLMPLIEQSQERQIALMEQRLRQVMNTRAMAQRSAAGGF